MLKLGEMLKMLNLETGKLCRIELATETEREREREREGSLAKP